MIYELLLDILAMLAGICIVVVLALVVILAAVYKAWQARKVHDPADDTSDPRNDEYWICGEEAGYEHPLDYYS